MSTLSNPQLGSYIPFGELEIRFSVCICQVIPANCYVLIIKAVFSIAAVHAKVVRLLEDHSLLGPAVLTLLSLTPGR